VHQAPGIPRALCSQRAENLWQNSGASRRGIAGLHLQLPVMTAPPVSCNRRTPSPIDFAQARPAHFRRKARMGDISTDQENAI
jgi:hypothetical protein